MRSGQNRRVLYKYSANVCNYILKDCYIIAWDKMLSGKEMIKS